MSVYAPQWEEGGKNYLSITDNGPGVYFLVEYK